MSRSGQGVRGEAAWAGPFLAFIKSRYPGSAPSRTAGRTMRRALKVANSRFVAPTRCETRIRVGTGIGAEGFVTACVRLQQHSVALTGRRFG